MLSIPISRRFLEWVAFIGGVFHILILSRAPTWFGFYLPEVQLRAISLSFALVLILLAFNKEEESKASAVPWWNFFLLAGGLFASLYVVFGYNQLLDYSFYARVDNFGLTVSIVLGLILLECLRRRIGVVLPILIVLVISLTVLQPYLPGLLNGPAFSWYRMGYTFYVGHSGIFGLPLGVAARIIIVFLIFSQLLQIAGAGKWFIDISLAVMGRMHGGPAKAAVLSSAFFGSISGSPSSNVATTGSMTIPLMKSIGYSRNFAGAVESVASTGGQILPPVMGAVAFVMADWIGLPYSSIAIASAVPAILIFLVLFYSVHFKARILGVKPLPPESIPKLGLTLKEGWFYLVPLLVLIYLLVVVKLQPELSALISLPFIVGVSYLSADKTNRINFTRFKTAIVSAMGSWLTIVVITASIGMLIGSIEMSGLALKISNFILHLGQGSLILTLLLIGLTSLLLGMGLDSIPLYMTLAILMAPALIELGVPTLAAHLYIVYWGMASFITPPVCVAVFVAVTLSGGTIWKTGWEAFKLGLAMYIVPFSFALNPALILHGSVGDIIFAVTTAIIGGVSLASGLTGFGLTPATPLQRGCAIAGGILLVLPGYVTALIGGILIIIYFILQFNQKRKAEKDTNRPLHALEH